MVDMLARRTCGILLRSVDVDRTGTVHGREPVSAFLGTLIPLVNPMLFIASAGDTASRRREGADHTRGPGSVERPVNVPVRRHRGYRLVEGKRMLHGGTRDSMVR